MKKNNKSSLGILVFLGLLIGAVLYLYNSTMFERELPKITLQTNGFWNLKKDLKVDISDNSGIKAYKVILKTKNKENVLYYEKLINPKKEISLNIEPPRSAYAMRDKNVKIIVEAQDVSKWNFFKGNLNVQVFNIKIDKKRPSVIVINNSYKISKGGSALVIFKAIDENLKKLYIETSFGKEFIPQPFYKDGYYISLLAWPVQQNHFRANIVAEDKAGNVSKAYVPLYLKERNYRTSHIKVSDKFLHGKIAELAQQFDETQGVSEPLEQFKIINEKVRAKNEALIHKITSKVSNQMVSDFKINKMYPLKNAQVVAYFGDHRIYSYKGTDVSESYHLGLDLASNAMAAIRPQNKGEVVFADYNGLYGNMPVISYGLGLYALFGHCSSIDVHRGDTIASKEKIANTGKTGYAMGDHLHFGVLVQGVEVRPQEWMDTEWMKLNINDIIDSAKKIIDKN